MALRQAKPAVRIEPLDRLHHADIALADELTDLQARPAGTEKARHRGRRRQQRARVTVHGPHEVRAAKADNTPD